MGLFVLRDIIRDSVLLGFNVTSQVAAHCKILARSARDVRQRRQDHQQG